MSDTKFIKGCEVFAEGALRAGCRFFAGYPITPQSEILEYMSQDMVKRGGAFVQSESEIAAINMVYGASCMGTRAMTSSSSPGVSLKTEGISYLAGASLPAVIVSVQRSGPGLGTINAAQGDYLQATKAPGHGGHRCLVYAPTTLQEAADLMQTAFDKADEYCNPVIVLSDGCMASMMETVTFRDPIPEPLPKHKNALGKYNKEHHMIAAGSDLPESWEKALKEKAKMYESWEENEVIVEEYNLDQAEIILTGHGSMGRLCRSVAKKLVAKGLPVGCIKPITLVPFPKKSFRKLDKSIVRRVISVEMANPGQMICDVAANTPEGIEVSLFSRCGGVIPTQAELENYISELFDKGEA